MSVQINLATLRVLKMVFEARYEEGYRYLDRCGETIVRIQKHSPLWVVNVASPQTGILHHAENKLRLVFGNLKMDVSSSDEASVTDAEKAARILGEESEKLYAIIVESLKLPTTTRVGVRFWIAANADSLEEADAFAAKGVRSKLLDKILEVTKCNLRDGSSSFVVENPETGLRRRISLSAESIIKPGSPLPTGLPSGKEAKGIVLIDVDTFTRPPEGHFQKVSHFVQESFLSSRSIAGSLFDWIRQYA